MTIIIQLIILGGVFIGFIVYHFYIKANTPSARVKKLNPEEQIDYHFSNIYNSLILFANSVEYLKSLEDVSFDPLFELESEFDIGFSDHSLNTNLENKKINKDQFDNLLNFKNKVLKIPSNEWTFESIEYSVKWSEIKEDANNLLSQLGVDRRDYNFDFTTIHYV